MIDDFIQKAINFSYRKHKGQLRDDGETEYFEHLVQVAHILQQVTDDENLIAAAYLHDTVEDTNTTYEDLVKEFNQDVADLVNEVTHEGQKDNTGFYFPRLKTKRGILLKFADRLSNLSDMKHWDEKRQQHYLNKSKFWKSGAKE